MLISILIVFSSLFPAPCNPYPEAGKDSLLVMFWNLENFFEWKRDTLLNNSSEEEFTSWGKRHWTRRKFEAKCRAVAKSVLWVADSEGRLPDVIGVAEIENRFVLERLLRDTRLSRLDYGIVHFESPDPRGIDTGLLYRKTKLKPLSSKPLRISNKDGPSILTRDILLAAFLREGGDSIAFLVNHHPSKYGDGSAPRRALAMKRLEEATDSLFADGWRKVIAMGDFNDVPSSTGRYSRKMANLASEPAAKGLGTIKYSGKWEMIDMFFISPDLMERNPGAAMKVVRIPFLMVRDNAHSGEKPFRTFTGPRYSGGVSDHCPITLKIQ